MCANESHAVSEATEAHHVLQPGGAFEFELEGNPSTGYDWDWTATAAASLALVEITDLGAVEMTGARPARGVVGAPVLRRWRVTARAAGTAQLTFSYRRSWERAPAIKTHIAIIEISN